MHSEHAWISGEHTILLYSDWPPDHKQVKKWALFDSDMWDPNWKLAAILGDVRPDDVFTATRNNEQKNLSRRQNISHTPHRHHMRPTNCVNV